VSGDTVRRRDTKGQQSHHRQAVYASHCLRHCGIAECHDISHRRGIPMSSVEPAASLTLLVIIYYHIYINLYIAHLLSPLYFTIIIYNHLM